jgi:Protein of unknown function (DUF559)
MVSRRQLRALGMSASAIDHWVERGRLRLKYRGVYALGHSVVTPKGRLWGALLACGEGSVISHRDGGAMWNVRRTSRLPVDVTIPGRRPRPGKGITPHHVRRLDPLDVTEIDGIPVTTLARTFLDLAEILPQRHVARAMEEAERQNLLDLGAIHQTLDRNPGRRGHKPLLAILSDAVIEPWTRSDLEAAFLQLCKTYGIPRPIVNAPLGNYLADMLWPDHKLIVELDSRAWHLNSASFETDRIKDAYLQLEYRVIRVTDRRLQREPGKVAATVMRYLEHASKAA